MSRMAEDLGMNSSAITQAHYQLESTKNSSILPPISPSSSIDLDLNFDDVFDFEKGNLLGEDEIINVTQINELNYFQL